MKGLADMPLAEGEQRRMTTDLKFHAVGAIFKRRLDPNTDSPDEGRV